MLDLPESTQRLLIDSKGSSPTVNAEARSSMHKDICPAVIPGPLDVYSTNIFLSSHVEQVQCVGYTYYWQLSSMICELGNLAGLKLSGQEKNCAFLFQKHFKWEFPNLEA